MDTFYRVNSSLCPRTTSIWNPLPTLFPRGGMQFLPKDHFSRDSDWRFHQMYRDKGVFDHSYWYRQGHQVMLFQSQCAFWGELGPATTSGRRPGSRCKVIIWSDFFSLPQSGPSFHVFIRIISLCQRSAFHWEKYPLMNK